MFLKFQLYEKGVSILGGLRTWATAGDGGWGAGAAAPPSPGGAQGVEEQGESSEIEFA